MKIRFVLLIICMLLISCSQSNSTAPEPTEQPSLELDIIQEEQTDTVEQEQGPAGPADIRVTEVEAVTNITGTVTEQGCSGKRIDLDITITNFGQSFPPDNLWDEWVTHTENSRANSPTYPTVDERALFTIHTRVDFEGSWKELSIPISPNTLGSGKFGSGVDLVFNGSVDIPWDLTLHEIENYTVTSKIRQASGLMPVDTTNDFFEKSFELQLPDIKYWGIKILEDHNEKEGIYKAKFKLVIENIGNALTPGPVQAIVLLHDKEGKLLGSWDMTMEGPPIEQWHTFHSDDIELFHKPGPGDTIDISIYMLCPSEQYSIITDANPQNNYEKGILSEYK